MRLHELIRITQTERIDTAAETGTIPELAHDDIVIRRYAMHGYSLYPVKALLLLQ